MSAPEAPAPAAASAPAPQAEATPAAPSPMREAMASAPRPEPELSASQAARYGEAVVRQMLGATFVREEPFTSPTRFG